MIRQRKALLMLCMATAMSELLKNVFHLREKYLGEAAVRGRSYEGFTLKKRLECEKGCGFIKHDSLFICIVIERLCFHKSKVDYKK